MSVYITIFMRLLGINNTFLPLYGRILDYSLVYYIFSTAFHVGAFISIVFACYSLWHDIKYVPECDMTETNACKFCSKLHPPAHYTYCRLCEQCIRGQVFHSALLSCCVGLHNSFLYKVIAVYTLGASVIFTFLCVYALFNNSPASERDLDDLV